MNNTERHNHEFGNTDTNKRHGDGNHHEHTTDAKGTA